MFNVGMGLFKLGCGGVAIVCVGSNFGGVGAVAAWAVVAEVGFCMTVDGEAAGVAADAVSVWMVAVAATNAVLPVALEQGQVLGSGFAGRVGASNLDRVDHLRGTGLKLLTARLHHSNALAVARHGRRLLRSLQCIDDKKKKK